MRQPTPRNRTPRPIGPARLEEMALAYVARFATSAAKLEGYLRRKLAERGWDGEGEPPVSAIVARFAAAGYIDDAVYARMKAGSLLRRGYGTRRIDQALGAAGIAEDLRAEVRAGKGELRRAALDFARRRRLGPFAAAEPDRPPPDRQTREKHLAALLRAGHRLDMARDLVDARSVQAAEDWAAQEED